jgi:DNA-directed RNA polymerase subunit RPC12/RpoP
MNKEEIACASCEAEFYIESDQPVYFCAHCGSELLLDEDLDNMIMEEDKDFLGEDY